MSARRGKRKKPGGARLFVVPSDAYYLDLALAFLVFFLAGFFVLAAASVFFLACFAGFSSAAEPAWSSPGFAFFASCFGSAAGANSTSCTSAIGAASP